MCAADDVGLHYLSSFGIANVTFGLTANILNSLRAYKIALYEYTCLCRRVIDIEQLSMIHRCWGSFLCLNYAHEFNEEAMLALYEIYFRGLQMP
jgi:hypothetical protein